jgi:hypothetical protein
MEQTCLNCRYWQPNPHDGWTPPSYDPGQRYDVWKLRTQLHNVMGNFRPNLTHGWDGRCRLNPDHLAVTSIHMCGQWDVNIEMTQTWYQWVSEHCAIKELREIREKMKELQGRHQRLVEKMRKQRTKGKPNA